MHRCVVWLDVIRNYLLRVSRDERRARRCQLVYSEKESRSRRRTSAGNIVQMAGWARGQRKSSEIQTTTLEPVATRTFTSAPLTLCRGKCHFTKYSSFCVLGNSIAQRNDRYTPFAVRVSHVVRIVRPFETVDARSSRRFRLAAETAELIFDSVISVGATNVSLVKRKAGTSLSVEAT